MDENNTEIHKVITTSLQEYMMERLNATSFLVFVLFASLSGVRIIPIELTSIVL